MRSLMVIFLSPRMVALILSQRRDLRMSVISEHLGKKHSENLTKGLGSH